MQKIRYGIEIEIQHKNMFSSTVKQKQKLKTLLALGCESTFSWGPVLRSGPS
jgi:hypothetical protein